MLNKYSYVPSKLYEPTMAHKEREKVNRERVERIRTELEKRMRKDLAGPGKGLF